MELILLLKNFVDPPVINLQRFATGGGVNTIGTEVNVNSYTGQVTAADSGMSPEMKVYYDTEMLENARNQHYYAQFGRKQPLPRGKGKIIEWRKWNTLPNAERLTEGVIPAGKNFGVTAMTSGIVQMGLYVSITDQLELHAIDNVIMGATEELGASAGDSQDYFVRNTLMEGTNVMYAATLDSSTGKPTGTPTGRWGLTKANKLTPDTVNRVATLMKKLKAPKINGKYVAIIHPSVAYDLRNSEYWIEAHKYAATTEIFNGEIGELHGIRFIESPEAMVWAGESLNGDTSRYLTCSATYVTNDTTATAPYGEPTQYKMTLAATPLATVAGRQVHVWDASAGTGGAYVGTVTITGCDPTNKYIWFDVDLGITPTSSDKLFPGEGGAEDATNPAPVAVYGCLFLGKDAYGIIDPDGGGLRMIAKDKSQAGGPLEQFSTVGYKLETGAKVLYEDRMVRVECCSEFSDTDEDNSHALIDATV